jgi:hypothetical protein
VPRGAPGSLLLMWRAWDQLGPFVQPIRDALAHAVHEAAVQALPTSAGVAWRRPPRARLPAQQLLRLERPVPAGRKSDGWHAERAW